MCMVDRQLNFARGCTKKDNEDDEDEKDKTREPEFHGARISEPSLIR